VVAHLAINPNTVLKAYRELEHAGLVAARPGIGTFVTGTLAGDSLVAHAALRRELQRWLDKARHAGLSDEVAFIDPVLERAGDSIVLVGHSYGAAVALLAALWHPERVAALVLYEPTLFAWIDADTPRPNDADGIRAVVEDGERALRAGDVHAAAERFIDYWMEPGSWRRMPESRRATIAATIPNMRHWAHALLREPTPIGAMRLLDMPVLLMSGDRTTASARAVTQRLLHALPQREFHEFEALGHMGPVTDAERVNDVIEKFLDRTVWRDAARPHASARDQKERMG